MRRFLLSCISFTIVQCVVHKTRLSVEFVVDDYHPGGEPIQTLKGLTRNKCMSSCARTKYCSAFNFRSENGMCMLHPAYIKKECMAENFTQGLEYVHMTDTFDGVPPWRGLRNKDNNHGYWKVNPTRQTGIPYLRSDLGAVRHVARVLYKGIYLPGGADGFNRRITLATPHGTLKSVGQCRTTMQHPVFKNSSYFQWDMFYAGWAIPTNAIVGGYWPDGTPLYITSTVYGRGVRYPGYYDAYTRKTYPQHDTQEPKLCILLNMSMQLSEPARDRCWFAIHKSGYKINHTAGTLRPCGLTGVYSITIIFFKHRNLRYITRAFYL